MKVMERQAKGMPMAIVFIILFLGLYVNIASRLCYEGVENFDWWSNDILISDMMYTENFGSDRLFLYAVSPSMICPEQFWEAEGILPGMFKNDRFFEKDFYEQYTSNIVFQRYFYRVVNQIAPIPHALLLQLYYLVNCLLAAFVLTLILAWINTFADGRLCLWTAVVLSAVCPYFTMYGKNLYWLMWTLFFPMACMATAVRHNILQAGGMAKRNILLVLISYAACTVKLLVCFEFMTSVMIAMTIPLFYVCFREGYNLKKTVGIIFFPFIGAMASFLTVFGVKMLMMVSQYGRETAFSATGANLAKRLLGKEMEDVQLMGPVDISIFMAKKEFMSVKGVFKITFLAAIGVCILIFLLYRFVWKKAEFWDKEYLALFWSTCLSLCAPLSWFVLAAPHTIVHNQHCTINWFIPFGILFIVLVLETIEKLILIIKGCAKNEI